MATPHQDFDSVEDEGRFAGTLKLGGRTWHIRHQDDVPFETVRRLMGQTQVDPDDPNADPAEVAKAAREVVLQTGPFFADTIVRDEVDEFMEMLSSPDSALTIGKLRPVMEYISKTVFTEAGDERPTAPSRQKQPGRSSTGSTSKAASSSRATRRRASAG